MDICNQIKLEENMKIEFNIFTIFTAYTTKNTECSSQSKHLTSMNLNYQTPPPQLTIAKNITE